MFPGGRWIGLQSDKVELWSTELPKRIKTSLLLKMKLAYHLDCGIPSASLHLEKEKKEPHSKVIYA